MRIVKHAGNDNLEMTKEDWITIGKKAGWLKSAGIESGIDKKTRSVIHDKFKAAGLDANGRFEKPDHGFHKAYEILDSVGFIVADVVSSNTFFGDEGHKTFRLERKAVASQEGFPFVSGEQVENTMLVFYWFKQREGRFEVHCYLS